MGWLSGLSGHERRSCWRCATIAGVTLPPPSTHTTFDLGVWSSAHELLGSITLRPDEPRGKEKGRGSEAARQKVKPVQAVQAVPPLMSPRLETRLALGTPSSRANCCVCIFAYGPFPAGARHPI